MDPESVAFRPESGSFQTRDDFWRFQGEMLRVQQNQAELSDRVSRLERKQDDDARVKNVWGTSSPFPSVLGGHQVPLQQPAADRFPDFGLGNLQLDADEEPRRVGATSRANSVRFDETANHGHWAHASRSSLELIPRTGSGMGGHLMSERSYSHKSDGRQSSAGQSVHSMTSGRANSLTGYGPTTPDEPPGLAPGLFILGSVPAIIRCWLTTNYKHDTLLYAAICSGSYLSCIDMHLVEDLGFQDQITLNDAGTSNIKLSVYLPEAVPTSASSRSSSPTPHLPYIEVGFTVIREHDSAINPKAVQIMIGSDTLRAHNADLLFSCNQVTLYDNDRCKLQIPFVRPEDERTFKDLHVSSGRRNSEKTQESTRLSTATSYDDPTTQAPVARTGEDSGSYDNKHESMSYGEVSSTNNSNTFMGPDIHSQSSVHTEISDEQESNPANNVSRSGSTSAIWSNWRREPSEKSGTGSLDWANLGKAAPGNSNYQRRDTGIKVLKPMKMSRTVSMSTSSSVTGQSRFFGDGKQRTENEPLPSSSQPQVKRTVSGEKTKPPPSNQLKSRPSNNPVGGASAFAWLNNGTK